MQTLLELLQIAKKWILSTDSSQTPLKVHVRMKRGDKKRATKRGDGKVVEQTRTLLKLLQIAAKWIQSTVASSSPPSHKKETRWV